MNTNFFLLNRGYVEDASNADVFLTSWSHRFTSVRAALHKLTEDLVLFHSLDNPTIQFDKKSEVDVYNLVQDFLNGDLQTHGQFLFDYGWNVGLEPNFPTGAVILVNRAPKLCTFAYLDDPRFAVDAKHMVMKLQITCQELPFDEQEL